MTIVHRVLYPHPIADLDEYLARGGGEGLDAARKVEPATLIAELEASGLRGRGGAGFPTGTKWRTVAENASSVLPTTVVVRLAGTVGAVVSVSGACGTVTAALMDGAETFPAASIAATVYV